jgi:predicted AAA+ superfamily ATPase
MANYPTHFIRDFQSKIGQRLSKFTPLIQVLLGPRQVGKTTAVKSFLETIPQKSSYLLLDNPGPTPHELIKFEWEKIEKIKGHKVLAIDEIQNVENWPSLVKELYDASRAKGELSVVLLGSSSLDILLRGEESLFGRFETIRAPHWNFKEMQAAFNWDLDTYFKFGGYPIIANLYDVSSAKNNPSENIDRIRDFVRDAIIEPVITRDILSLKNILNAGLFRQVLKVALTLPCTEISFVKFVGQLNEKGSTITVKTYLELLEKAFLIKLLYRYSGGAIRKRTSSPKIIPLAPALIHAYQEPKKIENNHSWYGQVFEASVISRIAETNFDLYYWNNSRQDVDLVIESGDLLCAIEIKSVEKVDFVGLNAFKTKYPNAKTLMIDRNRGVEILKSNDPKELLLDWIS